MATARQRRRSGKNAGIFLAVLAAIGGGLITGFGPELWKWLFAPKLPIEYVVKVFSSAASNPAISQAAVEITIGTDKYGPNETDPNGVALMPLDARNANKAAKLKISRTGFEIREKDVAIPISSAQHSVYLNPIAPVSQAASAAPPPPPPAEVSRVVSSGPRASGLGSNFSEWYELCSEPSPTGYSVRSVQFTLEGDRSCGAWSECRESRRTPDAVCWQFRLQGHNEWFPPRPAFSQGILRVVFAR